MAERLVSIYSLLYNAGEGNIKDHPLLRDHSLCEVIKRNSFNLSRMRGKHEESRLIFQQSLHAPKPPGRALAIAAEITCARSVAVGHNALQRTFLMTSGSKLMVIRRMMLSQAGPLDSICMKT